MALFYFPFTSPINASEADITSKQKYLSPIIPLTRSGHQPFLIKLQYKCDKVPRYKMMETVQKFKAISLMSDISTVLEQIRWGELQVSELQPAFYPELISSAHIRSNCTAVSLQSRGFVGQPTNVSRIERVRTGSLPC